jgi:ParB/RepB/Spo0J family partition protein
MPRKTRRTVALAAPGLPAVPPLPEPRSEVVALDAIDFSPFNKRAFVPDDPADLDLLSNLRATGRIIEPIVLRPEGDRYRLIAGERRVRFGREAGIREAQAVIFEVDETTANLMTFTENHYRKDLHYLEEAASVADLLASGCSQEMIAAQIGKPVKWVALRARLGNLSERWRELAVDPDSLVRFWSASHLEVVALLSPAAQDELLASYRYLPEEVPTISDLRGIVSEHTLKLAGSPWALDDETLCPKAGACSTCPHRSSAHPTLFDDFETPSSDPTDRCLDPTCWKAKHAALLARQEAELRQAHPNLVRLTTLGDTKDAIPAWSARTAKKNQAGAVPALVVDGPDRGKLRWVELSEPPAPAPKSSPLAPALSGPVPLPPGQRAKSSLEAREAVLDRRRKLLATETMATAIAQSDEIPPLETVLALAFVFGTQQTLSTGFYCSDTLLLDLFPDLNQRTRELPLWHLAQEIAASGSALADLTPRLWHRIRPVLLNRLANNGSPDDTLRAYAEASTLAKLAGVDAQEHLTQAAASLPDPASWAAERAATARAAAAGASLTLEPSQGVPDLATADASDEATAA